MRMPVNADIFREMNRWLQNLTPRPMARARLVCVPHAGGGPSAFMGWRTLIPVNVELWVVRLPGHEGRFDEPPETDLRTAAMTVASALAGLTNIPFVIFGHSLGAWLGFEVARRLRETSRCPAALVVSGRGAPRGIDPREIITRLPDDEFLARVRSRYQGIPDAILASREIIETILPALRADFAMLEGYRYSAAEPLPCPIHVFAGADDPNTSPPVQLEAWARETTGEFRTRVFPGGHFFVDTARPEILAALNDIIG